MIARHFRRSWGWMALLWIALVGPSPQAADAPLQGLRERLRLYSDDDAPLLRALSVVGRYHGQGWAVRAREGDASGWENRRIILGLQARLARDIVVEAQAHLDDRFATPLYDGLYVGFVGWAPADSGLSLKAGRLDYLFTGLERSTSSKRIVTFERGLLVNQLMPGEVVGMHGRLKRGRATLHAGLFSGDIDREFSDFDGGLAAVAGVAWELPLGLEQGSLNLDLLYNDGNPGNDAFSPYRRVVSLWHRGRSGRLRLGLDLTAAGGGLKGRPSAWGITLLPALDLADGLLLQGDRLQLALRYQYATSQGVNGLETPGRYEGEVAPGRGDRYQALYAGFNYLIDGDRLKLMAGVEYASMEDGAADGGAYRGATWQAGIRLYF